MSRWGEFSFCNGCQYQETYKFSGYHYGRCNKPFKGNFPEQCEVKERAGIEYMTSNRTKGEKQ